MARRTPKKAPKMTEAKDDALDRRRGIVENSARDKALDKKRGLGSELPKRKGLRR